MSVDHKTQSLFDAIAAANYDRVKLAIDSGVAINSHNERGQTPLTVACRQGSLQIVDLLVAAGAQMRPQLDPSRSRLDLGDRQMSPPLAIDETSRSLANARQIPFESLIDLIHQPAPNSGTEIEQIMPIEHESLLADLGASRGSAARDSWYRERRWRESPPSIPALSRRSSSRDF